ncbi:hypothetical protein SDC9_199201 [bioreactor metagenome]|uniref:Uncharacterized protein n=1 Tax=bioreactor metagenome TaxID=1076179 RepID=A0A645IWI5_9ZZZZ
MAHKRKLHKLLGCTFDIGAAVDQNSPALLGGQHGRQRCAADPPDSLQYESGSA